MVCKEIVYKNDYGNCISNDTGILTASSAKVGQPLKQCTVRTNRFDIEDLDYFAAVEEDIEVFDTHLNAYVASEIENKIISKIERCNKKECSQCINVFHENAKFHDEFINRSSCRKPCESTVNIIKASNKILQELASEAMPLDSITQNMALKTIMRWLEIDELYSGSDFDEHVEEPQILGQHKVTFIRNIVHEYMIQKSKNVCSRISEQERGKYIRHNNKKRVQEAGQ